MDLNDLRKYPALLEMVTPRNIPVLRYSKTEPPLDPVLVVAGPFVMLLHAFIFLNWRSGHARLLADRTWVGR